MSVVTVRAGACGFLYSTSKRDKKTKKEVRIEIESDCESVQDLGFILEELGPLGIKEIIATSQKLNRVFEAAAREIPAPTCPVPVAIIKVSQVALGLERANACHYRIRQWFRRWNLMLKSLRPGQLRLCNNKESRAQV